MQGFESGATTLTTRYYMGGAYEVTTDGTTETTRKYYSIAGISVAMHDGTQLLYFLTDHLGSVMAIADASVELLDEQRYMPFMQVRTDVGSIDQTDFGYTFQRNMPEMGLMDYKARMYDAKLGRFVQADSIVPGAGNPEAWNKYAYTSNNPIITNDPSGHYQNLQPMIDGEGSYEALAHPRVPIVNSPPPEPPPSDNSDDDNPFADYRDEKLDSLIKNRESDIPDITDWFLEALNYNGFGPIPAILRYGFSTAIIYPFTYTKTWLAWYDLVRNGGPWDYKIEFNKYYVTDVQVGGNTMSMENIANINYGLAGSAAGISPFVLHLGAGIAQITGDAADASGGLFYLLDEPADYCAINVGISLYQQSRYDGQITENDLLTTIAAYDYCLK
jgi:RHS repeat-associated protein